MPERGSWGVTVDLDVQAAVGVEAQERHVPQYLIVEEAVAEWFEKHGITKGAKLRGEKPPTGKEHKLLDTVLRIMRGKDLVSATSAKLIGAGIDFYRKQELRIRSGSQSRE